jgi:methyl-accepting chemotaxis protein
MARARALAAESNTMRNEAESLRLRTAQSDQASAKAMAQATEGLGKGMKRLASGDLTFQLIDPFAADFETLRSDFNTAVMQFSKTLRAIADASGAIDSGS